MSDVFLISFMVGKTPVEAIPFELEMNLFLKLTIFLKEQYFTEIWLPCRKFIFIKQMLAYALLSSLSPKY